ncbi:transglycosylase domain-containing protein [Sutcliffiella rhizosphaerae]|uniref:Penicillin-binding protein 1F n=1 Tax=Sutcliffiella rhizosphaerae TaxID=2880967 RepID=A0ABN8AFT9_9BACI|nr:PBP1A family penicillin-binding protein [Sutcliffiella rhizosphaerae]CAG9622956.1 Penicillin-binding protein 1F [Sutcliffiella rhizosphaerae]
MKRLSRKKLQLRKLPVFKTIISKKYFLFPFIVASMAIFGLIGYIVIILMGNYVIDEKKLVMDSTTTMVDENGNQIASLFFENREIVGIDQIPEYVQNAFVAVEDNRFYEHRGIDVRAIGRAVYRDILARSKVEGGSTLTQQLAKNIFLTNEKSWLRKTKEAVIAINLERRYTKKEIMEMYLNQIYFGHGAYGVQAASELYFNKDVEDLTVEQGAMLAALPKAPNSFSPINYPEEAKKRRDLVLHLMERHGYLEPEETVAFMGRTIGLNVQDMPEKQEFLTYIDMVMNEAEVKYGITPEELHRGGYSITVPLHVQAQKAAFERFQDNEYFPGNNGDVEGAFVLMDQKNGGVLAVIGGRNYVTKGINRVEIKRQPGSTLKPLAVYAPALEEGKYEPYSLLKDELLSYGEGQEAYTPRNYHHQYKKEVTMYDAIKDSLNAPAVWALNELGIERSKSYLTKMGLDIPDNGLAIALGGLQNGITPLELTKAYRAFGNNGKTIEPYFIKEIKTRKGEIIAKVKKMENEVFSEQTAWEMTRMLEGAVQNGTASAGELLGDLAGKTGTTNFPGVEGAIKDTWFIGYTTDVIGTVWMGYDTTTKEQFLTGGGAYPTRIFKDILTDAGLDNTSFTVPAGVTDLEEPIILPERLTLKGSIGFHPFSLFTAKLSWNEVEDEDERVVYRIYSVLENESILLGEVTGTNQYTVEHINVLHAPHFYVVPYNTQTEKEGNPSERVKPSF